MTTKIIGVKELRQNLSQIAKSAQRKNHRYIVMNHSTPIFELKPISKRLTKRENLLILLNKAEEDIKAGRVYSAKEIEKQFGLI